MVHNLALGEADVTIFRKPRCTVYAPARTDCVTEVSGRGRRRSAGLVLSLQPPAKMVLMGRVIAKFNILFEDVAPHTTGRILGTDFDVDVGSSYRTHAHVSVDARQRGQSRTCLAGGSRTTGAVPLPAVVSAVSFRRRKPQ